jgi:hypothetical protein
MNNIFENPRINSEILKSLIPIYIAELNQDYQNLVDDLKRNGGSKSSEYYHKIKGDALSYGVLELAELIQNRRDNTDFENELLLLIKRINIDSKDLK